MSLAGEEEGCVSREGEGRTEERRRRHREGERDDVAMAAATTTVYLTALLNLI